MHILVFNAGSSSLKYKLFTQHPRADAVSTDETLTEISQGKIHFLDPDMHRCSFEYMNAPRESVSLRSLTDAVHFIVEFLQKKGEIAQLTDVGAIGHRVVHGGELYHEPVVVTDQVERDIESLTPLAPLHNPSNLEVIRACKDLFPGVRQVAVFDTAFHQTIAKEAFLYGLPLALYEEYKIRKYGFHGISHAFIAAETARRMARADIRLISCHLGNGSSITAIRDGKSVDTSMGFSPLDGLIMGTRAGALDPEIIFYLLRQKQIDPEKLEKVIYKKSGLFGVTGVSSDVKTLHDRALVGDVHAKLGLDMLSYRITGFIGSYIAALNGVDAISFTGGIGEHAWYIRERVCRQLSFAGVALNDAANKTDASEISTPESRVRVFVIPANEELEIAQEVERVGAMSA